MEVIRVDETSLEKLIPLIAAFRVVLQSFKHKRAQPDYDSAREEALYFFKLGYPIYAVENGEELAGYMICRVDEPCVWVEHIYVDKKYRRQGAASMLFCEAERMAKSMGEDTVYNFVHPNNEGIIAFLRSKGYSVLNMLEIRKPYEGEQLTTTIRVNDNDFDY